MSRCATSSLENPKSLAASAINSNASLRFLVNSNFRFSRIVNEFLINEKRSLNEIMKFSDFNIPTIFLKSSSLFLDALILRNFISFKNGFSLSYLSTVISYVPGRK